MRGPDVRPGSTALKARICGCRARLIILAVRCDRSDGRSLVSRMGYHDDVPSSEFFGNGFGKNGETIFLHTRAAEEHSS